MASRPTQTEPRPQPRLYLLTPQLADTAGFAAPLKAALAAADVAAVLLRLQDAQGTDERTLINRAKALAPVVQGADAALLIDGHADLVARAGSDGVHLTGLADFAEALERLKPERIVGVGGLASRHDCMLAAERGADYVMFGMPDAAGRRPPFEAIEERVAWWAELFELPCVAYADTLEEIAPLVAAGADFIALGDWLWRDESAVAATLQTAGAHLRLPEAIT
jgi:thiamine-phosphate pyrophosphorylase